MSRPFSVLVIPVAFRLPEVIRVVGARWCGEAGTGFFDGPATGHFRLTYHDTGRMDIVIGEPGMIAHTRLPNESLYHSGSAVIKEIYIGDGGSAVRVILDNGWNLVLDIPAQALGLMHSGAKGLHMFPGSPDTLGLHSLGEMAWVVEKEVNGLTGVQFTPVLTTVYGDGHPLHDKYHWYRDGMVVCTREEYVPTSRYDRDTRVIRVLKVSGPALSDNSTGNPTTWRAFAGKYGVERWISGKE